MIKSVFKWPGSKAWLARRIAGLLPKTASRIVEPFAGSASFFFGTNFSNAFLADINPNVIDCLTAIRDSPHRVLERLSSLQNTEGDFRRLRDELPTDSVAAAARLIFLTNTSWGGLYRENKLGKFNVPYGYNGRQFFSPDTLIAASERLRTTTIVKNDFRETLEQTNVRDLLFIDAPYVTNKSHGHFDRYLGLKFTWSDQVLLSRIVRAKASSAQQVLVTCAASTDLYCLFPGWSIFEFSKRNSMTAHRERRTVRMEALLVSPSLSNFSDDLVRDGVGVSIGSPKSLTQSLLSA